MIYLLGGDAPARKRFATETFNALERVSRRMPRGGVTTAVAASQANERAEARMRQAASESPGETLLFEAEEYTVILEAGSEPRPAPLHRFLRLMPIDSLEALERVLGPFAGQLSNAAIAGFSDADGAALRRSLTGLGLSRLTEPGRLQTPPIDWPHDGMPLLSPLARFTQPE